MFSFKLHKVIFSLSTTIISRVRHDEKFGDEVTVLSRATYLVSTSNNINSVTLPVTSPMSSHTLLLMTSKADKLPLETEPVAHDNNTIFTLKPDDQTFAAPLACSAGVLLRRVSVATLRPPF